MPHWVEGRGHAGIESGDTKVSYLPAPKTGPKSAKELDRIVQAMAALGDDFPGERPDKFWQEHFGAKERSYFRAKREWKKGR